MIEGYPEFLGRRYGAGRSPRRRAAHLGQQEGRDIEVRRRREPHKCLPLAQFLEPRRLCPDQFYRIVGQILKS
jgi:hypothetical protein